MNVVICGGGNLGHAIAGKFARNQDVKVFVLSDRADLWHNKISVYENDGSVNVGNIENASSDYNSIIPIADIILVTLPGYLQKSCLQKIKNANPSKSVRLGAVQCFGGFFWSVKEVLPDVQNVFGFQRVPYICRVKEYGKSVYLRGYKEFHKIAIAEKSDDQILYLLENFLEAPVIRLKSYLEATLSNSNPLLHPSRIYSLLSGKSDISFNTPPLFYEEWDDKASEVYIECDKELQLITRALGDRISEIPTVLEHYGVKNKNELTQKLRSIKAFKGIRMNMIQTKGETYIPDVNDRYFIEDIPYGILIIYAVGRHLGIEMTMIQEVIEWFQKFLNKEYIINGRLIGKDIKDTGIPNNLVENL